MILFPNNYPNIRKILKESDYLVTENHSIKNRGSLQPVHRKNYKRDQQLEGTKKIEKYTEIERENRILLEKINQIMHKKKSPYSLKQKKSLNISSRINHQKKISSENLEIVQRLKKMKSFYDFKQINEKFDSEFRNRNRSEYSSNTKNSNQIAVTKPRKLSHLIVDIKKSVYSKRVILDNRAFIVDILKGQRFIKNIAHDETQNYTYTVELLYSDILSLIGEEENWKKLTKSLQIEGTELSLLQN